MIYKVVVPSVGEDVEEIRVLEWHGAEGTRFAADDLIVELETHKALVEMRAGQAGVLREIKFAAGEWAGIGVPIAVFSDGEDEPLPEVSEAAADLLVDFVVG
jgi:pyruvate/2-oxoglutarate dehydrogenase complex dihydrolipoamide acyltransferase (E2) component